MKQKETGNQHSTDNRPNSPRYDNVMSCSPPLNVQLGGESMDMMEVFRVEQASEVTIIPATKESLQNSILLKDRINVRVAAYCRVSTEDESQEESFEGQCRYFTNYITFHPGWTLVNVYADHGKSGTSINGRPGFNQMIEDANAGKIDYIIAKSISRFSRNTIDILTCVQELRNLKPPVGIFFEKEHHDTLNQQGDLFLSMYSSFSQGESQSISENIKWSIQKKFRDGETMVNPDRVLGYRKGEGNRWEIDEAGAEIVRFIYRRFNEDVSANRIAKELNKKGYKTQLGKEWRTDSILRILESEKYAGDIINQKTYTESFLTHKSNKNTGEAPQYYIQNHHPEIIPREQWKQTQELLLLRRKKRKVYNEELGEGPVTIAQNTSDLNAQEIGRAMLEKGKKGADLGPLHLLCCSCGKKMKRMIYNKMLAGESSSLSMDDDTKRKKDKHKVQYAAWKCPGGKGKDGRIRSDCKALTLSEVSIEQSFMEMLYKHRADYLLRGDQSDIVQGFSELIHMIPIQKQNSGFFQKQLQTIDLEIQELEKELQNLSSEGRRYLALMDRYPSQSQEYCTYASMCEQRHLQIMRLTESIKEKRETRAALEKSFELIDNMRKNYEAFLAELRALPDRKQSGSVGINRNLQNMEYETKCQESTATEKQRKKIKAGMRETAQLPFMPLKFNERIFRSFVVSMEAKGDVIYYGMSFGLMMSSEGNSRPFFLFRGEK